MDAEAKKWFKVAHRLALSKHYCIRCVAVLATHGLYDAVFGQGPPTLCATCADGDEDWRLVDSSQFYDPATRKVLVAMGASWCDPEAHLKLQGAR